MDNTAFEFQLWQPIYHNNEFSHNTTRRHVQAADHYGNQPLIDHVLKPGKEISVNDTFTVRAEPEYIKSVRRGKFVTRTEFVPDKM